LQLAVDNCNACTLLTCVLVGSKLQCAGRLWWVWLSSFAGRSLFAMFAQATDSKAAHALVAWLLCKFLLASLVMPLLTTHAGWWWTCNAA
jgi:hypothetical protein